MGGLVYAIGGHDGQRYLNTVEAYDPVTNSWTPVTDIKDCRAGAGVAWADCSVDDLLRPFQTDSAYAPSGVAICLGSMDLVAVDLAFVLNNWKLTTLAFCQV
ncbi:kelch repeat protein [Ancylostoma duodenale]|uniref:Kelch repeat protein n=1 Tax=Ancylostoma duodenale TaxID=51022 RepID=A0A0C2GDX2_9BILA|nr:kelch repeat protein [Ancylostoma duodenale]